MIKDWIDNYFKDVWVDCEEEIDFSQHEPIDKSSGTHVYIEKYFINDNTYRRVFTIGSDEALVQVLQK